MSRCPGGAPGHRTTGRLRPVLAIIVLSAVAGITAGACSGPPPLPARDRSWQQDIAYLARKLPAVRQAGLGAVSPTSWRATATRLEAQVPRLTDGQIITGLAQMVAKLPRSGLVIQYTTAGLDGTRTRWGIPDAIIRPTLAQILAGDDPVLAAALSYRPPPP